MKPSPTKIYHLLFSRFGPQHWWPMDMSHHQQNNSDPRFEVIIGAVLTQNTSWSNVEIAIENLKKKRLLSINEINQCDIHQLKILIRSSGFFNQKAKRLQTISSFLQHYYEGDLDTFFSQPISRIRSQLISINGIGPETADSILLYAGMKPVFVVDAYTKRLCHRLNLPVNPHSYNDIQRYFQHDLLQTHDEKQLVQVYNECHAVIVGWAKNFCRKSNPICSSCPLWHLCPIEKLGIHSSSRIFP